MTFHNIFSSSIKKQEEKPKIIIDHREKNSLVVAELLNKPLEIEFQQLPIADYLIKNIAIERKTVSDFKSSVINKRILAQIENLKQYPQHLLILEGILEEDIYNVGMHENAFRGFLLSLALQHNIHIIYTHNAKDTAKYLYVLAMKKENSPLSIRPSKISLPYKQQAQYILEGFPFIGPIKSKKLLEKFKSLKNIFNASEEELKEILGKRAKEFKNFINQQIP